MIEIRNSKLMGLVRDLETKSLTLDVFWREIHKVGTPLIESTETNREVLVTFLWKGTSDTKNVVIQSLMEGGPIYSSNNQLIPIPKTNIWFGEFKIRADARFAYHFVPETTSSSTELSSLSLCKDIFNPLTYKRYEDDPVASVVHLPLAPDYPWLKKNERIPRGSIKRYEVYSTLLKNKRDVWLYLPFCYDEETSYPIVFFTDGDLCLTTMNVPNTLDNLIAEGKIPPVIAVMISPIDRKTRSIELTCNATFSAFMVEELIPFIKKKVFNKFVDTIISGISYGGLTAMYTALLYPEIFDKVLSQSGSFWWSPDLSKNSSWFTEFILNKKVSGLSIYLEAGLFEDFPDYNLLESNREVKETLIHLNNKVYYSEFAGGHDDQTWPGTLGLGLVYLLNN